jgi:hypothetical protein
MAATKYTYSIATDFPNKQVDSDSLTEEINDSAISSAALFYIETSGDDCDIWFDDPLSAGDQTTLDGIVAAHTGAPSSSTEKGGLVIVALDTPSAPTVTPQGTPGSTTWGYKVTAFSEAGETLASTEGQTTSGAATLTGTNFNRVTWSAVPGATKYGIYRSTAGGTPSSTGKITETKELQFDDTGQAASGSEPSEDRSGAVIIGADVAAFGKKLNVVEETSDTSTVTSLISLARKSSGTVAAGFGTGVYVQLEDDGGTERSAGSMHVLWSDPAAATLEADFRVMLRDGGGSAVERARVTHDARLQLAGTEVLGIGTCVDAYAVDGGIRGGTTAAGSNNDIGAVRFDTGGDGWNRINIRPPSRYTSGDLTFRILCSIPTQVGANKGTRWSLQWAPVDIAGALPSSWTYSNTYTYDISSQTADDLFAIDFTITSAQFDKTADMLAFKLTRVGTDPADDCGQNIYVHLMELRYSGYQLAGD